MKIREQLERIEMIHRLIQQRRTGRPKDLADRVGLSVSRLARIIEYFRDQGAPIKYDRSMYSYYYTHPFEINISIHFGKNKSRKNSF